MDIGEVATPAARDTHFLGWSPGVIEHENVCAALSKAPAAEEACSACTQDQRIDPLRQFVNP